jgi:hypothetical protein
MTRLPKSEDERIAARVAKALAIIKPSDEKREVCRDDIEGIFDEIEVWVAGPALAAMTKKKRLRARQFRDALLRAMRYANDPELPFQVFFGSQAPNETRAQLIRLLKELAGKSERWERTPGRAHHEEGRAAASQAAGLLIRFSVKKLTTTKTGDWCRLAALLYRDGESEGKSMQHYVRESLKGSSAKRGKN